MEFDALWYGIASYIVVGCFTVAVVMSFDPTLQKLTSSPVAAIATATLGCSFFWVLACRRIARNQFQFATEWICASGGLSARIFRDQLGRVIQRIRPTIEARRSGAAGAALTLSLVGLLIINHQGPWLRPCFAVLVIGLTIRYAWLYSQYNSLARRVHVDLAPQCPLEGVDGVECPGTIPRRASQAGPIPELST